MDYQALTQAVEEKLNLSDVPQEEKEEIITELGEAIIERTMLAITESLTEDEAALATSQLTEGKVEDFLNMLSEKHPELNDIVVGITNEVMEEFVEAATE